MPPGKPPDPPKSFGEGADEEDAIVLEVDDVGAGHLALADAIAKALHTGR
jgi:hypothetical protein